MIFQNLKVAFAQVTGDGNDNGQYLVGVFIDKKQKKALIKERNKVWDKGNTGARKTPSQSIEDWMAEDEETGKEFLWLGIDAEPANPSHALDYIVGEGDSFGMKDFGIIGAGSEVTVEFNMYITKKGNASKKGENVGRSLIALQLLDLVPFEGGSTPTTLKGKKLSGDGTSKKSKSDDKKGKKKKKSKK